MTDTRTTREAAGRDELDRAQRGDRRAFLHLYEHDAPLAWRLSLVAGRDPRAAEAAVVGSFARVLGRADRRDVHRFAPVDAQLLRAARETAIEQADRIEEPAGLEAIGETSHIDTLRAFDRLPERWRTVLWLDQIERLPVSTTAVVLGATEQSAAGLTTRALAGLREQVAQLLVVEGMAEHCRYSTVRLAGYAARALPSRDTIRVRRHLDRCEACRARLDDLDDVTPHLRGTLPVLPLAVESLALGAWLARSREGAGPIGLHLPGGALAPAWVERSLAGATAAVVTLGITAAVLMAGRGGGSPVPTESAIAATEGESALQSSDATEEDSTDGSVTVVDVPPVSPLDDPTSVGDVPPGGATGGDDPAPPSAGPAEVPRGGSTPTSPSSPPATGPGPAAPSPSTDDPADPSSPPSTDPVDEVVSTVDDAVESVCGALGPVCDSVPIETPLPQIPGL